MPTKTIDVHNIQERLDELLNLVQAGTEVIFTDGSKNIARLVPISNGTLRTAGLHTGAITTSDDFDEPLPDQFWTGTS